LDDRFENVIREEKNQCFLFNGRHLQLYYSVFHRFRQAKFGSILSLSQFLPLTQLPQKVELTSKVVKVDSKIIVSLPKI
jgi:hypothetical protein